jgi:beta-galactosidase
MKNKSLLLLYLFLLSAICSKAQPRTEFLLEKGWKFSKGDHPAAKDERFDDNHWETVTIPHDWAIYGPFDRNNDLQEVAVTQNFETGSTLKTGRTGGLPCVGVGWYRNTFDTDHSPENSRKVSLLFDGAMSEARVYVNGHEVCFRPYGYSSFHCDVTQYLNSDGRNNLLAVRLENLPESSRWYSGAGLYRNVHLITTNKVHVPIWGMNVTTPFVSKEYAALRLKTKIAHNEGHNIRLITQVTDRRGNIVTTLDDTRRLNPTKEFEQNFIVENPELWSPENPHLYQIKSKIYLEETLVDEYTLSFGIRDIRFIAGKGFFLNGERRKFRGVCNHHDLGPLGAAVNEAALRRQLTLLKDMGCDAIRTTHNMPAPELVRLCDEMGFMMIIENFDEWNIAKCKNGYHRFFDEWAEKDMTDMLHNFRNNPSVVMWSIGNEVPNQCNDEGYKVSDFLQAICHREDPSRPVTSGIDQVTCALENGFASTIDIPGLNYRTQRYVETCEKTPQKLIIGSETASTVSSRGIYKFPVEKKANALYDDHQSSSYDWEYCPWSNIPDEDFALAEDHEWTLGQFVWTGFDYLGEPTPYHTDAWPNHSSMFGIIDLATIPKDRYYLYRSVWNRKENTLHLVPHWTWNGRENQITPVFVYTNHHAAELFVNGKSYGRKSKNPDSPDNRYRLIWMDVLYEPGELKVIAYNEDNTVVEQKTVRTAGKPYSIELIPDRTTLNADGKDLVYINVRIADREGNLCPHDSRVVRFTVKGEGKYRASANGDPTCLQLFHQPLMSVFNGQLTTILQSGEKPGELILEARAKGLKTGIVKIKTQ